MRPEEAFRFFIDTFPDCEISNPYKDRIAKVIIMGGSSGCCLDKREQPSCKNCKFILNFDEARQHFYECLSFECMSVNIYKQTWSHPSETLNQHGFTFKEQNIIDNYDERLTKLKDKVEAIKNDILRSYFKKITEAVFYIGGKFKNYKNKTCMMCTTIIYKTIEKLNRMLSLDFLMDVQIKFNKEYVKLF